MIKIICVTLAIMALPIQAIGQDMTRARQIEAAWRGWVQAAGITDSSIAIGFEGAFVRSAGLGRTADEPADIASLSKAITAVCLADVLAERGLSYETRIGDILENAGAGLTVDITIAQLISHGSGLDEDQTQSQMRRWVNEGPDRHQTAAERALDRGVNRAKIGQFLYNNENYAVLGWLISNLTGEAYIEACMPRVFPDGGARASDRWGAFAAWGGWQVSAETYLDFVHRYFGAESAIGRAPETFPNTFIGRGKYYGMGSFWRAARGGGHNFWHFGRLCFGGGSHAGAYFASYAGKWTVSVNFDACITPEQQNYLDTRLWRAANEG